MEWIYLFSSFNGRISRQSFWIACVILAAIQTLTQWLAYRIEGETLATVLDLAITYPQFAIAVKRSNDRNLTPWIVALLFAINVALDLFVLSSGTLDPDSAINNIILVPFALLAVILIVELGFRRGTSGPNRFGPDPLADGAPAFLSQYTIVRWLNWWLETLVPDGPIIRGGGFQNLSEELPRSVRSWCLTTTAVNAVICVIATFTLRSIEPVLVFALITAIGPINLVFSWKWTIKYLNSHADTFRSMGGPLNLSLEWCAIFALLGLPIFMIIFIATL